MSEQNRKENRATEGRAASKRANAQAAAQHNRTQYYKHVQLERERPHISRGSAGAQRVSEADRRRNFDTPGKDPDAVLKVIPLGGLDAIGKNMTVFECGDDIVLDDAGCMFPDDSHPGIDLILPDYSYLLQNAEKLRGIVITHGHED
ncbi:MAG: hypothetical protein Q3963_03315, partial [Coriobacteriaceae bacterium]|nr:hypothetical protein [Coriobacteriaceae bacterium]